MVPKLTGSLYYNGSPFPPQLFDPRIAIWLSGCNTLGIVVIGQFDKYRTVCLVEYRCYDKHFLAFVLLTTNSLIHLSMSMLSKESTWNQNTIYNQYASPQYKYIGHPI